MRSLAAVLALASVALLTVAVGASTRPTAAAASASPLVRAATTTAPASARATPVTTLTPPAAATPLPAVPQDMSADPRAGTIESRGAFGGWGYDGATGVATSLAPASTAAPWSVSPSGRYTIEQRRIVVNGLISHTELWISDALKKGPSPRLLYRPTIPADWTATQPNMAVPPYVYRLTQYAGSWSPDERFFTAWIVGLVSASADADGRPLVAIDVPTGALTDLGATLLAKPTWRAPHMAAYVAGGGRETWLGKTVRIWSPETGPRDVTGPADIGLKPTWDGRGRLWYVTARAAAYDPPSYFALKDSGDRSIAVFDLATGAGFRLPRVVGYADEGVRPSADGRALLILRRRAELDWRARDNGLLSLWIADADGSSPHRLMTLAGSGFGYYGSFGSLDLLTWTLP